VASIGDCLNEEPVLQYRFDVLNYNAISEPASVAHIDRVGESIVENI